MHDILTEILPSKHKRVAKGGSWLLSGRPYNVKPVRQIGGSNGNVPIYGNGLVAIQAGRQLTALWVAMKKYKENMMIICNIY